MGDCAGQLALSLVMDGPACVSVVHPAELAAGALVLSVCAEIQGTVNHRPLHLDIRVWRNDAYAGALGSEVALSVQLPCETLQSRQQLDALELLCRPPWSARSHPYFPWAVRERAVDLLLLGSALARCFDFDSLMDCLV